MQKINMTQFLILHQLKIDILAVYGAAWNTATFRLRLLEDKSRASRMDSSQQLVSNYVRSFVENDGGKLRFVPKKDEYGRPYWELYGILPDGTEQQVKLSKTGRPRLFKSADAVIAYWQDLYPEASEVTVPVLSCDSK